MQVLTDWLLTPARTAIHLPTRTAVIGDAHLGYARARRRRGDSIPEEDLTSLLAPLASALEQHKTTRLLVAGDLFETGRQVHLTRQLLKWIESHDLDFLGLVPGNHDRGIAPDSGIPLHPDGYPLDDWHVVHGDGDIPEGNVVQGHEHPCFRHGPHRAPCYLVGSNRLVLPAYSLDASGVATDRDARWLGYRRVVIAGDELLDFGESV